MANKEFKRPDPAALQRIYQKNGGKIVEIALRLACRGFTRDDMHQLKWSDVSFENKAITLPDREVPLDEETLRCLERRHSDPRSSRSEYVMTSDRGYTHIAKESLSRLMRDALNEGGLTDITAGDLRKDFVIRMLETHDWTYVARITGTALTTLYVNYSEYFTKDAGKAKEPVRQSRAAAPDYEDRIWQIIAEKGTSAEGLTLWLAFELDLQIQEIIALTWDQVDLARGVITLPERTLSVSADLLAALQAVKAQRTAADDPHVILTPRSKAPFDQPRISRTIRELLIRSGIDEHLHVVLSRARGKADEADLLSLIARKGYITRREAMQELSLTKSQFYKRERQLIEKGEVVRIGTRFYLAGTVVPPERQYEVISAHLQNVGAAYCSELAELLGIGARQCGWILACMVKEGKLAQTNQMYRLPD